MAIKNEEKRQYAEMLYIKKFPQKVICERVGVTPATLTKWKKDGGWEAKRAAQNISPNDIIAKALVKVNEMLDNDEFNAEKFAKAVAPLKKLQDRVTPDDKISTLMSFGDWLVTQIGSAPHITAELVQILTQLQDLYITSEIRRNG